MDSVRPNPRTSGTTTLEFGDSVPAETPTVDEARIAEDYALARRLVELLTRRLEIMPLVAHTKYLNDLTIDDTRREQELFERLTASARWHGVPEHCACSLMSAQLEASKQVQFHLFFEWLSGIRGFPADQPSSLSELREEIDVINVELIQELSATYRRGVTPGWYDLVMQAADSYEPSDCAIPAQAIRTAVAPLARMR